VLARLLEGHLDALAILDEAGREAVPGALYGVWASASGGTGLTLRNRTATSGTVKSADNDCSGPPASTVPGGFDVNRQEGGPGRPERGGFDVNRQEGGPGGPDERAADRSDAGVLSGLMRFCSGAPLLDRALTTARDEADALHLFDIGVRDPRLRAVPGSWPALGMDASASLDVEVQALPIDAASVVGGPGFYVERSGLHLGGMGVAAVWLGGLQGLLDATLRVLGQRQPDEHGLAHLGAVSVALESAAATLVSAAQRLSSVPADADTGLCDLPSAELGRTALICRSAVESAVGVGVQRLPRVVGPVALGRDGDFAHRLADLEVFVRQHHGERDLARLGTAEYAEPWSAGPVAG